MAEERSLTNTGSTAPTRISDDDRRVTTTASDDDTELTKEELQRRMEEARESISSTVAEIKDTVQEQYDQVKETINDSLDWREQYKKRPAVLAAGAAGAGLLLGLAVGGVFRGGKQDYSYDDADYDADDYTDYDDDYTPTMTARDYRDQISSSSGNDAAFSRKSSTAAYSTSVSDAASSEPEKPGILERLKETSAYDKLTQEVGNIGSRVADELSHTAQTVVLPMLLGKIKDLIGIDIGTQRQVAERSRLEQQTRTSQPMSGGSNQTDSGNQGQQSGGYSTANNY